MKHQSIISYDCMEMLVQWVKAHCCVSLISPEGRDYIRGLYFIVDEELRQVVARERAANLQRLQDMHRN